MKDHSHLSIIFFLREWFARIDYRLEGFPENYVFAPELGEIISTRDRNTRKVEKLKDFRYYGFNLEEKAEGDKVIMTSIDYEIVRQNLVNYFNSEKKPMTTLMRIIRKN